jgi:glutaminase
VCRKVGVEPSGDAFNSISLGFCEEGIAVVCSRIRDRRAIMGPLSKAARKGDRGFLVFEDNDLAVAWCENRLIRELPASSAAKGSLADSVLFCRSGDLARDMDNRLRGANQWIAALA